jgi:hypothetical protein
MFMHKYPVRKTKNKLKKQFGYFFTAVFLICFFSAFRTEEQSKTFWVENGAAQAVIVTADAPYSIAAYAAEEVVHHIKLATGVTIPVRRESEDISAEKHRIYIGQSDAARKAGIDHKKLKSEQCIIRTEGNDLFIVGNDGEGDPLDFQNHHAGTLWGVYEVLEQVLGVRWLWPGELGTHVSPADRVEGGEWNKKIKPTMVRRNIRIRLPRWSDDKGIQNGFSSKEAYKNYIREEKVFLRRHRIGRSDDPRPYTGHSFNGWLKEYGGEHPEWFQKLPEDELANEWRKRFEPFYPLYNIPDGGWKDRPGLVEYRGKILTSMCVSNPEFQQEIVNRWKERRKENPDQKHIIRIGENDTPALCTCEECHALDAPQLSVEEFEQLPEYVKVPHRPMNAGRRYALFWKRVQKLAAEVDPDAIVTAFIYFNYFVAPDDVKLHENIVLSFVPWDGWWFPRDPREQQWLRGQWKKWRNTGATLYYRPNYMYNGGSMPHVFARQMAGEFQYVYQNGAIGTDFDALTGQWAVNGTTLYLLNRLHNRPGASVNKLLNEYYTAFGPAALHIKAYFDFWEAHATTNRAVHGFGGSLENYNHHAHKMFPPESFEHAEKILTKAVNAVADEKNRQYAQRIDFLRKGLEHARMEANLAALFNDEKASEKEWSKALQELVRFRCETEHMHIANFAYSAGNNFMAWSDRFNLNFDTIKNKKP